MMIALGTLMITSLLVVAAFTAATEDVHLTKRDTVQKQAYYASLAGVQEFEYHLQENPDFWETCPELNSALPDEAGAHYHVEILPAASAPEGTTKCESASAYKTAIETKLPEPNTFRIEATGCSSEQALTACPAANPKTKQIESSAKISVHQIVATFQVKGFLDFVYYTNHEDLDPALYTAPAVCDKGEEYWPQTKECQVIYFKSTDKVNGPFHSNDAVCMQEGATFGRSGEVPPDSVEFFRGLNTECPGGGVYNTSSGTYLKGEYLIPPESDQALETYATSENEFEGVTKLVLNGAANTITVTNKGTTKTISWPSNGLIWVKPGKEACKYKYEPAKSDDSYETENETNCANVYLHGTYTKSLTVGSGDDVIINGNLEPTGVTLGKEPTGESATATLGLIANNYVRIYHPVTRETHYGNETCSNAAGSLESPWIYAGILSTQHSFIVDNYECGNELGHLNVFGAIAQNYRGIVGTFGSETQTGYTKNYNYDNRLAVDEPPYFLAPLKSGWKVVRQTAPTGE